MKNDKLKDIIIDAIMAGAIIVILLSLFGWEIINTMEYPNIDKLQLISEFRDRSGDLRNSRLCAETGQCP